MLENTLDKTMERARKYERKTTKASKFSNLFKNIVKDNSVQEEIMTEKLKNYIKPGMGSSDAIKEIMYDEKSLIVEDPDTIPIEIKFNSSGLPFFKSLYAKLKA